MEPVLIITVIITLIVLLLIIGAPLKMMRTIGQGIVKILIGAIILFILNLFGNKVGLHIPINFITASISGLLGLPGIASLIAIKIFIL